MRFKSWPRPVSSGGPNLEASHCGMNNRQRASVEYLVAKNMRFMRALSLLPMGSLIVVLLGGCTTPSGAPDYTGTGALVGAASGAGLGALIDHRHPGAGALIGGAAGAITGGLLGHSMDEQARTPVYVVAPPPPAPAVVVPAPGPGYAWVNGQWVWNGAAWVWSPGHWVLAR